MSEWNPENIEKTIEGVAKTVQGVAVAGGILAKLASFLTRAKGRHLTDPEIREMFNGLLEEAKLEKEHQAKLSKGFLDLHRQQSTAMYDLARRLNKGQTTIANAIIDEQEKISKVFLDLNKIQDERIKSLEARIAAIEKEKTSPHKKTAAKRVKRKTPPARPGPPQK